MDEYAGFYVDFNGYSNHSCVDVGQWPYWGQYPTYGLLYEMKYNKADIGFVECDYTSRWSWSAHEIYPNLYRWWPIHNFGDQRIFGNSFGDGKSSSMGKYRWR